MKRRWGLGLTALVLTGLALALWVARRPAPGPAVLEVSGRIEGDQAAVAAKVGGKIVRLAVREGDRVEAGAVIVHLASDQVRAQLEQAEHALHTAREQLTEAPARTGGSSPW
jgi:HlyD family secretion protein